MCRLLLQLMLLLAPFAVVAACAAVGEEMEVEPVVRRQSAQRDEGASLAPSSLHYEVQG